MTDDDAMIFEEAPPQVILDARGCKRVRTSKPQVSVVVIVGHVGEIGCTVRLAYGSED